MILHILLPGTTLRVKELAKTTLTTRPLEMTFYSFEVEKTKTAQMQRNTPKTMAASS